VLDIAEHMPKVRAHAATLLQAVANLLSNSMKFVAPGVRPKVRVWTERREDGMIRLCIEDNGIGIDTSAQTRIFKVFERLHGIESYPGTGIGLAVVARACERLGATCGVHSEPGQGSRFWIDLKSDGDDQA
jgi:signal transduction histidine kinase